MIHRERAFLIRKEPFTLRQGGTSRLYLNHREFLSHHKHLKLLADVYIALLPKTLRSYKLVATDSVMSPILTGMLSARLKKDIVSVREKTGEHGLEKTVYGIANGEGILIDDVASSGTVLVNATKTLRDVGMTVRYAIVSACRDLEPVQKLKAIGITALYVATYEEIIRLLWPNLDATERSIVKQEIKEKTLPWKL